MSDKTSFGSTFGGKLITGTASSLLGGLFNIGSQRRAYKYNQKLMAQQNEYEQAAADRAYRRQLEFYERQLNDDRTYNDPSAVKQRYLDAGLNPYSAFGTAGSYKPLQAPSLSGVQPADVASAPYMDPAAMTFGDPLEAAYKMAMIRKINADADKTRNETPDPEKFSERYDLENTSKRISNDISAMDLFIKQCTATSTIEEAAVLVENMRKQGNQIDQLIKESESREGRNKAEKANLEALERYNIASSYVALAKFCATIKGIELTDAQIANIQAKTATEDAIRGVTVALVSARARSANVQANYDEQFEKWRKDHPGAQEMQYYYDVSDSSLAELIQAYSSGKNADTNRYRLWVDGILGVLNIIGDVGTTIATRGVGKASGAGSSFDGWTSSTTK